MGPLRSAHDVLPSCGLPAALPAGLPAGRAVPDGSPVVWRSDKPPSAPLARWTRCQRRQGGTGLLPILCYADDDRPRPLDLAEIAAVDLEAELEQSRRAYRRDQLARLAAPSEPLELPEDIAPFVEPWEDDPGAPFDHWPGLAPATLASCGVSAEPGCLRALDCCGLGRGTSRQRRRALSRPSSGKRR
ncbi:hypothetical protein SAMN02787118_103485 [Streptomyces mirabilis]|uniref:Uncharacterized protein n=1 Tax=Streptomyces mirabilis TaxID=68239 RepID=A0A1I2FK55_9ACTN|nr:hypothetical protein SAMN02787118_103485 [Streptomyces mirabilis]